MATRSWPLWLPFLYLLAFGVIGYFVWTGSSYYLTPLVERPRHPDFWSFKPGGETGHGLGVAGSALMVLMLLYSVRKRIPVLRRYGELRVWLHLHIFCGVVGPLLVILHSSFKVQGLVALSFWSMIVVATSGFVGRYLYLQVPRRRSGDELTLEETEALCERLRAKLRETFGMTADELDQLDTLIGKDLANGRGVLRALAVTLRDRFVLRRRLRRFARQHRVRDRRLLAQLTRTLERQAYLERRIHFWRELQGLFYGWHLFHKPFAVIMYLFMILHVAVAIATGYGGFGR